MTELLTAAQMRAIEAAAIASGEVTGLELMERAGRGVVEAIFEEWPELAQTSHRAVVLCGPGGNGGDGFVVARLLKEWGWEVEVFLYGTSEQMPPDARVNYERWRGMGEVVPAREFLADINGKERFGNSLPTTDVLIDAGFGTGLARPVPEEVRRILYEHFLSEWDIRRSVAVDIPSGLCADSGRPIVPEGYSTPMWPAADGYALEAALTVTFHRRKCGHVLALGQQYCGKVVVKDIGLKRSGTYFGAVTGCEPSETALRKHRNDHKFSHGHALILSGPSGRGGAARLAARGALRIGAGVVTVGCPPDAIPENAARLDAVMLRAVADAAALAGVLDDARINALCLGPGMGTGAREAGLLAVALGVPNPVPGLTRDLGQPDAHREKRGPGSGPGRGMGTGAREAGLLAVALGVPNPVPGLTRDLGQPDAHREKRGPGSGPGRGMGTGAREAGLLAVALGVPNPVPGLTRDLGQPEAQRVTRGPGSSPGRAPGSSPGRGAPQLVLDADALTILSQHPDLFAALHGGCILTPHAGEFTRLFPDIALRLAAPATTGPAWSKVDATREASARAGCVVLFKGPDTVIADPAGRCAINSAHYDRAAPWLATAGSGDVLAGFITGLLARGFSPFDAACTGAWLHVECARSFGPGLIAEDLPEELPKVFRALGL